MEKNNVKNSDIKRLNQFGNFIFCPYADFNTNADNHSCEDSKKQDAFYAVCSKTFTDCDKYQNINLARKTQNHI